MFDFIRRKIPATFLTSMLVTGTRVAGIVLQAGTLIVLTHILVPSSLGVYSTVYACTAIMRLLGPFGFDQLAMRGALAGDDAGATIWDALAGVSGTTLTVALLAGGVTVASGQVPAETLDILLVVSLLPAYALSGLLAGHVRGQGGVLAAQLPESIALPGLIAAFIGVAYWLNGALSLRGALVALFTASWLVAAIYAILALRMTPGGIAPPRPRRLAGLLRESSAIFVALTFTAFSARAPMLIALPVLGATGAAVTEVANRFGTLGTVVTSSVATTFSPVFARAARDGDGPKLKRLLLSAAGLAGASGVVLLVALAVVFPLLIGKVLPEFYSRSYVALLLLALGTAVNAAFGMASNVLFMSGDARRVGQASAVQTTLIYGLGVPLALLFGVAGIGVAFVVSAIVRDGSLFLLVWRRLSKRAA